jgi:hypothetical protein
VNCGFAWDIVEVCHNFAQGYAPYFYACACYGPASNNINSAIWYPYIFEGLYRYCPAWAATADPLDYNFYMNAFMPCTYVGNFLGAYSTNAVLPITYTGGGAAAVQTTAATFGGTGFGAIATASATGSRSTSTSSPSPNEAAVSLVNNWVSNLVSCMNILC